MNQSTAGRIGAHESWANTVDRSARTAQARRSGPAGLQWHLDRLPKQFANASEMARTIAAESARSAYYARLAAKSADSRRRAS